jgi:hypothetical protein
MSILLLTGAIGAALVCGAHLEKTAGQLAAALTEGMVAAADETADLEPYAQKVKAIWDKNDAFYHCLLPHSSLNELEWTLGTLEGYTAPEERELFFESCVRGLQCVATLREMEKPTWGNIF